MTVGCRTSDSPCADDGEIQRSLTPRFDSAIESLDEDLYKGSNHDDRKDQLCLGQLISFAPYHGTWYEAVRG